MLAGVLYGRKVIHLIAGSLQGASVTWTVESCLSGKRNKVEALNERIAAELDSEASETCFNEQRQTFLQKINGIL